MKIHYYLAISSLFIVACSGSAALTHPPVPAPTTIETGTDAPLDQNSDDQESIEKTTSTPIISPLEQYDLGLLTKLQQDASPDIVLQNSLNWLKDNPAPDPQSCTTLSVQAALLYQQAQKIPDPLDHLAEIQQFYLQIADYAARAALVCSQSKVDGQPYGLSGHLSLDDVDSRPALLIYYLALKMIGQVSTAVTETLINDEITQAGALLGPAINGAYSDNDLISRAFCGLNTDHLTLFLCGRIDHE